VPAPDPETELEINEGLPPKQVDCVPEIEPAFTAPTEIVAALFAEILELQIAAPAPEES